VLDNGRCLYCTPGAALGLRRHTSESDLTPPVADEVITLIDMGSDERFELESPRLHIGRDPENDIVVAHDTTSRSHAVITFEYGRYWVDDLGSLNGTRINGSRILDRERLSRGNVLSVGDIDFLVC
jgi:pSer/pThr/pTyr-binding forkhead associated (FHA) protein